MRTRTRRVPPDVALQQRKPPAPAPQVQRVGFSQSAARERRRRLECPHYLEFDPVAEVREQCAPLAAELADLLSSPPMFLDPRRGEIDIPVTLFPGFHVARVASSVGRLRRDLVAALASADPGSRLKLSAVVSDPVHERGPVVDDDGLMSGAWLDALVAHLEPVSGALGAVVAGRPRNVVSALDVAISYALSGADSSGEDYFTFLDPAVRELGVAVERLRGQKLSYREHRRFVAAAAADREAAAREARLRKLGVS